jgi:hypothetical protein
MSRLVRKNLMVDADELRLLAERRGTSESEAVREAVRQALAAERMVDSLKQLHDIDAFADFEQLFGDTAAQLPTDPAA